jgi:solute carrier family 35 protein C2
MQNLIHFILATIILFLFKKTSSSSPEAPLKRSDLSRYFLTTFPCAVTGAIDIGISSYSLRIVSLAFYTMVKSSAPVFVLLSGFVFGIEKPSFTLFLTIFTIGSGVFLTSMTKTTFDRKGFALILVASFMAGFRWAFIQYLMEKRKVRENGILTTIRGLCFPISLVLLILSLSFEGIKNILTSEFFNTNEAIQRNVVFILLSGSLSFFLLLSEFMLVSQTSVIFLSVSGIFKELVIVMWSVCRKDIILHGTNYLGLVITGLGILMYNYFRRKQTLHDQ